MSDHATVLKAQRQMQEAALELQRLAPDVADAKQVKEFHDVRLKRILSVLVVESLKTGVSATAAEHHARASDAYGAQTNDLFEQYKTALRVIETYEATKVRFESARSLL